MRITDQPAFVLHTRPWRESSLLIELLSRDHGRVGVIARGVRGPKRQPLRAALQPLQAITIDYVQRGELAQLRHAEASGAAPRLGGDALMAAFYLNELLLRLLPRDDPSPGVHARYGDTLAALAGAAPVAWTLRRFERDLLDAIGYGLSLDVDVDGVAIDPAARYRLDPGDGAQRVLSTRAGDAAGITGAALLALATDTLPPSSQLRELRGALRGVIAFHLGARGLRSWGLLGEFARVAGPLPAGSNAAVDPAAG